MFTESQNGWSWKGPLEIILFNPSAQTGPPKASCPWSCPDGFWISLRMETPQPPWATYSSPWSPSQQKSVSWEPPVFHLVPIVPGPVTGHHWNEPGSVFFASSLQVLIYINKNPPSLLFSRLNSLSFLSLSLYVRCSCPLIILVTFCWTLSNRLKFLLYWGAQNWTHHSRCSLTRAE